jgi:hypothetical protein
MNGSNTVNQINHDQRSISSVTEARFLGLIIDDALSWKQHIDSVINRLSSICYALQSIWYIVSFTTLRLVYFAQVQSIMSYGIIFWGGSSHAKKVFILQNKIIRIITNTRAKDSYREIFKKLEIMMLYSQYKYILLLYIINNKDVFSFNNEIHKYTTRFHSNLHVPLVNNTKKTYVSGIKVFNQPFFFYLVCEAIGTAATPGLLCQPRVIMKMIVEKQMECNWQGKLKFSEKTCPSATFVHHKIPYDQTQV